MKRFLIIFIILAIGVAYGARLFDDAATEDLTIESPAVEAYPFAMACWFNSDDDTTNQTLMWVGDKGVPNHWCAMSVRMDAANQIQIASHNYGDPTVYTAVTSTGATVNTWHHGAGIWLGVSERHAYIDSGSKGSNTGTVGAMHGHDRTSIGYTRDSTPGAYMSGHIAEAAFWDLTDWGANDAEREVNFERALASLAKGYSPLCFPLGLVNYWPLTRDLNDKIRGFNLTADGTVVSAHPRIYYPY